MAKGYGEKALAQRRLERRAVEVAIWGMPIVSVDAMRQAFLRDAKGRYNDVAYLSQQADWRFQITTPNASSWYVFIPINTATGPIVLDIPAAVGAGLFGNINDAWQVPAADVGPGGLDGGKGGKYAVLPPGHDGRVPAGFFAVPMNTFNGYSFLRAIPQTTSAEDVAKALDLVRKVRVYELAQAGNPPAQRYIDIAGKTLDGVARFDASFYTSLARMIDEEPVQPRDLAAMQLLDTLGIRKGHVFRPGAALKRVLARAALEARDGFIATTRALPPFYPAREEERRRFDRGAVRRMRRQGAQLPADRAGVELPGPVVSPARGDPRGQMDVSRSAVVKALKESNAWT